MAAVPGAALGRSDVQDHRPGGWPPRQTGACLAADATCLPASPAPPQIIYEMHVRGFTADSSSGVSAPGEHPLCAAELGHRMASAQVPPTRQARACH